MSLFVLLKITRTRYLLKRKQVKPGTPIPGRHSLI
jgi:hypothetical protein